MIKICDVVESTIALTEDREIVANLLLIKRCACAMEDRLLAYCNAIEDLGFSRNGRIHEKAREQG